MTSIKICPRCKENIITIYGWCDVCRNKYSKEYHLKNKDKCKKLGQQWREDNRDHYREHQYKNYNTISGKIRDMVKSARNRAKEKNVDFNIDIFWITELHKLQNNKCYLTNIEFIIPKERNVKNPYAMSLDRIDSSKGYTKDNVRLICWIMNIGLHNFGEDIFYYICIKYLKLNIDIKMPVIIDECPILNIKQKRDKKYRESLKGIITGFCGDMKKRKKEVNIDKEYIENLFKNQNNKCSLTNIEFDYNIYKYKKENPFRPSLDRIDCTKGYIKGNVRLVCVAVNFALNEFGEDIFKKICQSYIENKKT